VIGNALAIAFRQLARNKVRSALTSLGILIGVAAVIAMLSIGFGAQQAIEEDLASFGNNLLFVMPGSQRGPGATASARPFQEADVEAIRRLAPRVAVVAPFAQRGVIAVAGDAVWRTTVQGSSNALLAATNGTVATGRSFDPGEEAAGAEVCLVGATVAGNLFGAQDPLDRTIRIESITCRVIGTLVPKGENTFGVDQDDFVLVPLRTLQRRLIGNRDIGAIFVSAAPAVDTRTLKTELEGLMRQRRHIAPGADDDFRVNDMAEMASMLDNVAMILTGFLAAVAAVSLLVGGIGIMNIMLVSVTERTREIGIRLAVGAQGRDVLLQFLVEAMVLSGLGGVAGIGLGVGAAWLASFLLEIPLVVSPLVVAGAFVFSALMGVIFGFVPARRAARMRPIDALRHE
jgi:putative ABC transport system permease protein